jgi:GTP-binding protein
MVPRGTIIINKDTNEIIADLDKDNQSVVVARGGKGGKGNKSFATPTERAPHYSENGGKDTTLRIELRLKILSDVGIIGLPNAGKSTLLTAVSNAKPTIANYPFTTLSPKIGMVKIDVNKRFLMADLPGLIEGASKGKGMGNEFLAHVERTKVLLVLIDGTERTKILSAFKNLAKELKEYNPGILNKQRVVVVNKIDLWSTKRTKEIKDKFNKLGEEVYFISALHKTGLDPLLQRLYELVLSAVPEKKTTVVKEKTIQLTETDLRKFLKIEKTDSHTFKVTQDELERRVQLSDLTKTGSIGELNRFFKKIKLEKELIRAGIKEGDRVIIGNKSFIFEQDEKNR